MKPTLDGMTGFGAPQNISKPINYKLPNSRRVKVFEMRRVPAALSRVIAVKSLIMPVNVVC